MSFIKKAGAIAFLVLALGVLPTTSHALMMTTGVDTPTTTPATTIEALQAQVKALLAEIVSLKAQLGQTNTTTSLDFSINGLYFSAPVSEGQEVSLAWKTNNVENCYLYYPGKNGGTSVKVSASGTKKVSVYPSKFVSPYAGLSCTDKSTKQETHKYVTLVATSTTQASCTISTTKTSAATGDTFTIKWTTAGITAPVMYQNVKAGGYVAVAKSGSMTWTAETGPTTDVFSIGTGGLGGINTANSEFKPLCSTKVTISGTKTQDPSLTLLTPSTLPNQQITIGSTYRITWNAANMPSNAIIDFSLIGLDGKTYGIPQSGPTALPGQGAYTWSVKGPMCVSSGDYLSCSASLKPGQYQLVAKAYTGVTNNRWSGLVAQATSPWITLVGSESGLPKPTINSFTASPSSITAGQSVTLSWNASNTLDGGCYIKNENGSGDGGQGSWTVTPSVTTAYTVSCSSSAKDGYPTVEKTLVVNVGTTTPTTATYRGYMNGSLFITTNNISEADALANCKLNASNNSSSAVRCTWGDKEIYSKNGSNDPVALTMPVIVGVYQGTYPAGVQSGFQYHPESTVNLNIKGRATDSPQPLVLTSYEPVNWVISNPNNVPISKIVTIGYYNQRVTNIPAGVSVQSFSNQAGTDYRYTYQYQDANYKSLVNWLGTKFGYGDSGVFFGGYSGSSFDVSFGYKG